MVSPELLADDDNPSCAGTIFLTQKPSSFERRNAKDRKKVRTHADSRYLLRLPHSAECETAANTVHNCNLIEGLLMVTPREKVCRTDEFYFRTAALVCPRHNQLLGVGIGQRPQQNCID